VQSVLPHEIEASSLKAFQAIFDELTDKCRAHESNDRSSNPEEPIMTADREHNPSHYLRNCYFPNTPRSNENAANEIAYGAAVCIEEIKERGMEDGYGLSLIVERSDSKHQFILTIEACKTEHQHEMAQDAETVAEHWVSPMKLRFLEADGQDALEEWCEGVVAGLREDADDSGRESNPSGHSTGMMVGVGIGAFIVGSMVTAASYNSVVVGPLFRRIQDLEKKPPTP
jgi:hypothetical protein